jgi:hypothetical protein
MRESKQLFRDVFRLGRGRKWKLNHSSLYLDFLAGNQSYNCTPWGNPTRNVFGWQKPCYLLVDEGYAPSFTALMEETPWHKYGNSKNPKCANCMAHCGYEASAVEDAMKNPWKAAWVALFGPRTQGPMAAEPVPEYEIPAAAPRRTSASKPSIKVSVSHTGSSPRRGELAGFFCPLYSQRATRRRNSA